MLHIDTIRLLQLMDERTAFDFVPDAKEFKEIHSRLELFK